MESVLRSKVSSVDVIKKNKASPILATFQNSIKEKSAVCKRVGDENNKYALVATDKNVYKADITNNRNELFNTFIAVHNKKTNKVQLIEVQNASFKHVILDDQSSAFEQNIVDSKKVLSKDFGGKKAQAAYTRANTTGTSLLALEDSIEKTLHNIDTDKFFESDIFDKTQEERQEFCNSIFPNIDISAKDKSVRDIFKLNLLIGNDMIEHLSEVAIEVLNTSPKDLDVANQYIKRSICNIQIARAPESKENVEKMSMLLYADALIRILNASRKKSLSDLKLSRISKKLEEEIFAKFTLNKHNSNFTRQKTIFYYLILILLSTESLEISLSDLLDSVSLSKNDLIKYGKIIGCNLKGEKFYIQKANLNESAKFEVPLLKGKKGRKNK